jgi:hypothetical protein
MSDKRGYPLNPKAIAEEMLENGCTYGSEYPHEYFEKRSLKLHTDPLFSLLISSIADFLNPEGFHLTARGMKGKGYQIVPITENRKVIHDRAVKAARQLSRGLDLGNGTPRDELSDPNELRRLEHETLRVGLGLQYLSRLLRKRRLKGEEDGKPPQLGE